MALLAAALVASIPIANGSYGTYGISTAQAAAATVQAPPDWSGLNVTDGLAGIPVPDASGVPLAEVDLDPALGLASAGVQRRVVYSTVNAQGSPAISTAALFVPPGNAPTGGWPVLAWAHGTTGLGDRCTPSAQPRSGRDADYLNHWLAEGYAVVASDYVGMGTPGLMSYLNGRATAAQVVDAATAAHDLTSTTGQLSPRWAVIGQSQGGGVALHVAHNASTRSTAAGLDYRGAVATGAPAYIEEVVLAASPVFPPVALPAALNAYAAYILAGFRDAHPDIDVNSALSESGRHIIDSAETQCVEELEEELDGQNLSHAFVSPLREVPGLESALRDYMSTPTDGYDRPVFLGHGLKDADVPTPVGVILNSDMWIHQFIGSNSRVDVHWYPTDHSGTMSVSVADSTPFLANLFS